MVFVEWVCVEVIVLVRSSVVIVECLLLVVVFV